MRRRIVAPVCRIVRGASRDHRRMRLSILLTLAGLAAWVVGRIMT